MRQEGPQAKIMTTFLSDTRPEVEQVQLSLLRQVPPWRKLEMLDQLNQTAHTLALSGLQQRYPQATPKMLRRYLADLLLGQTLAAQVYGPLISPEQEQSCAV